MTPEKRQKIQAMLDNHASTENEKVICRKILEENPEDIPRRPGFKFTGLSFNFIVFEEAASFDIRTMMFSLNCDQCKNIFYAVGPKDVYCAICLAAKQREADEKS